MSGWLVPGAVMLIIAGCGCMASRPTGSLSQSEVTTTFEKTVDTSVDDIEAAHKNSQYAWISEKFAGPEGVVWYEHKFIDHWTWQYIGYSFLKTEDYPRATIAFRRMLAIKPDYSPTMYNLA